MDEIKRVSLSEQVLDSIINYIQKNDLKPGDKLPTENEFAKIFGVSRTSIREAIKALSMNGVLRSIPGRGTFLEEVTMLPFMQSGSHSGREAQNTISDVMEVRKALECKAIELAVYRCSDEDVRTLREISEQYDLAAKNGTDVTEWGNKFHACIAQASNNPLLISMLQGLSQMVEKYRQSMAEKDIGLNFYSGSHKKICAALEQRNVKAAVAAMNEHLEQTALSLAIMAKDYKS